MKRLSGWLVREARRQARGSDLASALLLNQGARYARYRLGFVLVRLLLRTGLHALEVLFLSRVLPFEYMVPLLSYRALLALATTLHWGAIESLRQSVREAMRQHQSVLVGRLVRSWISAGAWVAALPTLYVIGRMLRSSLGAQSLGVSLFDAYALACCLRLGFDVYARSYHAGIFALRRVYRPLPTLLLSDLLEVAIIVVGFDRLGAWSIPLAIACAAPLDAALCVYYARQAYERQRLPSPQLLPSLGAFRDLDLPKLKAAGVQSMANAGMQLDSWLLLVLVYVDPPHGTAPAFATIYYVLRPLLGLATHWVRSFYFDLSRVDQGLLRSLRPRLLRLLRRVALACALLGAALTVTVAQLLWPAQPFLPLLWLMPFFAVRALFALGQLEAFAAQRYRELLAVTTVLAAGISLLAWLATTGVGVLAGSSVLLAAAGAWLHVHARGSSLAVPEGPVLGLAEWLSSLHARDSVCVGILQVSRSSAKLHAVMHQLAATQSGVRMTRHGRDCVLMFMQAEAAPTRAQLIAAVGGTLTKLWLSPNCHGPEALALARAQGALPDELQAALGAKADDLCALDLVSEFQRAFAAGTLLDFAAGTGTLDPRALPRAALGTLLRQISAASRQHELRSRLPVELAVYAPAGHAQLVFVTARPCPGFAAFRARVRAASLHASWHGAEAKLAHASNALSVGALFARLPRF